jgi:hypothetical protein
MADLAACRPRLRSVEDAEIIEVSTAQLDDVVPPEDRYGRVGDTAP